MEDLPQETKKKKISKETTSESVGTEDIIKSSDKSDEVVQVDEVEHNQDQETVTP